ncbi:MAG: 2-succinyl-5-enolpyruvyl-6-hydroxy-3-cyclohexene-1-carboxylic-acid synthase [Bacteroidales bacterium]|nr:2-succinyl-5-enolpyruvyl-6-hydroxy-3-cyclohexene-1-carboxylic-acid synthase [Bacteroidales bacterium]
MTSDKKIVSLLADLFAKKGLENIVISSGSRNAPIILAFANHPEIKALSVIDERSAAFFALGIAQQTKKGVAIACTSGSAVLNYAPAIAEAYYQKIPLLILTADRPPHMIDIGDGQTLRQENVFSLYVKKSYSLPVDFSEEEDFSKVNRLINEALDNLYFPEAGPVHINLPFDEPLYNLTEEGIGGEVIDTLDAIPPVSENIKKEFAKTWNENKKIMILAGQASKSQVVEDVLSDLSGFPQVTILTETTSNLYHPDFIDGIDNALTTIHHDEWLNFFPDFLITFGGAIVSKKIKSFLRRQKIAHHWHISLSGEKMDTYFSLSQVVSEEPSAFFKNILSELKKDESDYRNLWLQKKDLTVKGIKQYLNSIPYCDFKVFETLMEKIPAGSVLHFGNSTPVRYSQLFGSSEKFTYFSNRGVSGIDGQTSTASGVAFASSEINTLITGDLGFFYDSNALMNLNLTPNFKMIVINNGGGGIFRFIPGPDTSPQLEPFFVAKHFWKAEKLAAAFDVHYFKAENLSELEDVLPKFYENLSRPALLEIFTPSEENAQILRNYFSFLKSISH